MTDFPGIPGYKIVSKLNTGGMATIYLGIQEKLNRKVAIKVLQPSLLRTKDADVRFEQEAKTAASLSHSNIIQIHDTGKIEEFHYIVMEYLEESLRDKMNLNNCHGSKRGILPNGFFKVIHWIVCQKGQFLPKIGLSYQHRFHVMVVFPGLAFKLFPHTSDVVLRVVRCPALLSFNTPGHSLQDITRTITVIVPRFAGRIVVRACPYIPGDLVIVCLSVARSNSNNSELRD